MSSLFLQAVAFSRACILSRVAQGAAYNSKSVKDMAQLLLHRMMDQRSRDEPTRPGGMPAGVLRSRRATARWRTLGDKMMDLMGLVSLRERVWGWLPDGSQRLLGLGPSTAPPMPSTSASSTPTASDKQLEYSQIIKVSAFLGLRKSKEAPTKSREQCEHPITELKGGGNQYSKEVWCNVCKGRWAYLTPDKLQEKIKEISPEAPRFSSGPMGIARSSMDKPVMCSCGKEANRWEVKKEGPTKGRHFYRCHNRLCDFFQWDEIEQKNLKAGMKRNPGEMEELMELDSQENTIKEQLDEWKAKAESQMLSQARAHQEEVDQLKVQLAWMQSYLNQHHGQSSAASVDGFQLLNEK